MNSVRATLILVMAVDMLSCAGRPSEAPSAANSARPSEVIDLGALVTEDLPQQVWGKALLKQLGFTKSNAFDVIKWSFPVDGGNVSGSNAYYTLFNHGGPHVDAPNHFGAGGGIDSYGIDVFVGPVRVFDVSSYDIGRSVPITVFRDSVRAGDIVLLLTGYRPPTTDDALPQVRTLTNEAAEFLGRLPVRAIGTDAFSIDPNDLRLPTIHHAFLPRGIPIYEQLLNVDKVVGKNNPFFVGVPLNVKGGDGMMVRPVVFVY